MKLINKIARELKTQGFKVEIESFSDKSGSWISFGNKWLLFNYKGTKIKKSWKVK